jgi:hypothetical protein
MMYYIVVADLAYSTRCIDMIKYHLAARVAVVSIGGVVSVTALRSGAGSLAAVA